MIKKTSHHDMDKVTSSKASGFQYTYGDTPLEGYTIQHAAGRGGFGEVYYALSDAGRQVALKVIRGYEDIELRGISQCMNLKSPHLVTIFDVKRNEQGIPFVIMEYVSGPSLRNLIDETEGGLGKQKAAFFLREIGKGLGYLHEAGIVHRDLKPANIFYEHGQVKIGDYGLSKAMAANPHTQQTITVGTVQYMAPEVGGGRYDKSVDIYAMGVLLYEMLTGRIPFAGESPAEILMKHVSADPVLDEIDQPFADVIRKAMAKNPADRYQSIQEMVEALFGEQTVQQSMSQFSPDDLSMIAERAAAKLPNVDADSDPFKSPTQKINLDQLRREGSQLINEARKAAIQVGSAIEQRLSGKNRKGYGKAYLQANANDSIPPAQRRRLYFMSTLAFAVGCGLLTTGNGSKQINTAIFAFTAIIGIVSGIFLYRSRIEPDIVKESKAFRHFVVSLVACAGCILCAGLVALLNGYMFKYRDTMLMSMVAILVSIFLVNWHAMTAFDRRKRLTWTWPVLAVAIGWFLSEFFGGIPVLVVGVLAGTALGVQVAGPMDPTLKKRDKKKMQAEITLEWDNEQKTKEEFRKQTIDDGQGQVASNIAQPPKSVVGRNPISHYRKLWALLFAIVPITGIGIFGLQRFYVNKIGTGILYLCTFGLLGIGQFIDVILILTGQFSDSKGRRLKIWTSDDELPEPQYTQVRHAMFNDMEEEMAEYGSWLGELKQKSEYSHQSITGFALSGFGLILLIIAMVVGLVIALGLPQMLAAGIPNQGIAQELTDNIFKYSAWPGVVSQLGFLITAGLMVIAATLLVVARRTFGMVYMLRALIGSAGLLAVIFLLYAAFSIVDWAALQPFVQQEQWTYCLDKVMQTVWDGRGDRLVMALVAFLVSVLILAWPPKRRLLLPLDERKGGVAEPSPGQSQQRGGE